MYAREARYRVIYNHKDQYPIKDMCQFLGVSRSAYYGWVKKLETVTEDDPRKQLILEAYQKSRNTYGYRRIGIWIDNKYGVNINHKAVYRLMQQMGLRSIIRRRKKYTKIEDIEGYHQYPNVLDRQFHAERPNQKWATDVTHLKTKQGKCYLSAIKDLYDGSIISWHISTTNNVGLVLTTLKTALEGENVGDGLIIQSDQGHQFVSHAYYLLLQKHGMVASMSRRGNCLDNACIESFFGQLKDESLRRLKLNSFDEAYHAVDDYMEFYNFERIQLKTKLAPKEVRSQFYLNTN